MVFGSAEQMSDNDIVHTSSIAMMPLTALIGVYFYKRVSEGVGTTEHLATARKNACAVIDANLAILPRMIYDRALTREEAQKYRTQATKMKLWASACVELMTLGQIHAMAQMQWVDWYVRNIASNSLPLKVFLYLCEKQRLQTPKIKIAMSDGSDDSDSSDNIDEYEHLIGALMEDPRVAPSMLMSGRPKTVPQCVEALQKWCCLATKDGETLRARDIFSKNLVQNTKLLRRSHSVRNLTLLARDIRDNKYGLTKDMGKRLCATEESDDGAALRRYLIWEMKVPNCLELEAALFKALYKLPQWGEMLAYSIHQSLVSQSRWPNAVYAVIEKGVHALLRTRIVLKPSSSLRVAIVTLALRLPNHQEALKAAYADTFPSFERKSPGSFADDLFKETEQELERIFKDLKIQDLAQDHDVKALACIFCLLPPDVDTNKVSMNRSQRGKKRQSELLRGILESFMAEARPILKLAYGRDHTV